MMRLALAASAAVLLSACASVERVERLEARVVSTEARISAHDDRLDGAALALHQIGERAAELEKRVTAHDAGHETLRLGLSSLDAREAALSRQVAALERFVSWSGRFTAAITPGPQWQVIYANSTGESQKLRVRMVKGGNAVKVRITEIARIGGQMGDGNPAAPEWDMSSTGSQRWLRLGCGQELGAMAADTPARFEILVSRDASPVRC